VDEEGRAVFWAFDMTCQSCGASKRKDRCAGPRIQRL